MGSERCIRESYNIFIFQAEDGIRDFCLSRGLGDGYERQLLTHREEDKRVRGGKDAEKGATVSFWRLAGGVKEELLALRVLLFVFVAIFFLRKQNGDCRTLSLAPEYILDENGQRWSTNRRWI